MAAKDRKREAARADRAARRGAIREAEIRSGVYFGRRPNILDPNGRARASKEGCRRWQPED